MQDDYSVCTFRPLHGLVPAFSGGRSPTVCPDLDRRLHQAPAEPRAEFLIYVNSCDLHKGPVGECSS